MMKYPEDFLNKVICGNNRDILRFIPDKSIDCILTDPPYLDNPGGSYGGIAAKKKYIKEIYDNNINIGFDFTRLDEYIRILKNVNIITFCGKNEIREYLNWIFKKQYRWKLITWHKTNPTPLINGNYLPDTEYIFHIWDGFKIGGNYKTKKGYYVTSVIKNIYEHPTVKPIEIIENLIQNASNPSDIILDPFCGSGTTCVAAKKLGRNYIGIDIKEKYTKISENRISKQSRNVSKQKSLWKD